MDIEIGQKNSKKEFLEIKKGLPDCKGIGEMIELGLDQRSSERKSDRIMDRLNNSLKNHK